MAHIYKITSPSGKIYIGSTVDLKRRIAHYKVCICFNQKRLYNSIKKYGWDAHILETVEQCEDADKLKREAYWGAYFDVLGKNGLNVLLPKSDEIYKTMTDDAREAKAAVWRGRKHTEETKAKMSKSAMGNQHTLGYKQKPESIEKTRAKLTGQKRTPEQRRNCKAAQRKYFNNLSIAQKRSIPKSKTAKLVLNLETGVFYESTGDAAKSTTHLNSDAVRQMLNGQRKNKSNFIAV